MILTNIIYDNNLLEGIIKKELIEKGKDHVCVRFKYFFKNTKMEDRLFCSKNGRKYMVMANVTAKKAYITIIDITGKDQYKLMFDQRVFNNMNKMAHCS